MKTEIQDKMLDTQLFYEININLSTMKSLLIFLDLGLNKEFFIEDNDLANITTLLKDIVEKTMFNFEQIEKELKI